MDKSMPPWTRTDDRGEMRFPPPPYHEIVALGAFMLNEDYAPVRIGCVATKHDGNEESILREFGEFIDKSTPRLVSWGGRKFDLPVMCARSMRYGVDMGVISGEKFSYRDRYRYHDHLDLKDFMSMGGASPDASLDQAARLVGMPGKVGVDGTMVESMIAEGRIAEVRNYCLSDVAQTTFVFMRVQLMRGVINLTIYQEKVKAIYEFLQRDPRLATMWIAPGFDEQRLLLGEISG